MRNIIVSLASLSIIALSGCSRDDAATGAQDAQRTEAAKQVSQAETMEEIWASQLDAAEKARRVKELLAVSGNSNQPAK